MEVIRFSYKHPPKKNGDLALALGNFDGVHRGHERLLLASAMSDYIPSILFFSEGYKAPATALSSLEDKIALANLLRIERVYVVEATPDFYALSKDEFMDLLERIGVKQTIVGEDFRFGKGGEGTPEDLKARFLTKVEPLLVSDGRKISSREIRSLLENGQVEKAGSLIGRPYEIKGKAKEGFHNGRKIGFPTLNLELSFPYVLPHDGVYAGIAIVSGSPYRAMINVGRNPTVGKLTHRQIEAYLFGYEGQGYGKTVYLSFVSYIREEKAFPSLEELKIQLEKDRLEVAKVLSRSFEPKKDGK